MTNVVIKDKGLETKHKVGNIYKKVDDGLWLLCNVDGKAVLVSLKGGWFYSESLQLCTGETMQDISLGTFHRISSGARFDLVENITISEE